MGSVAVDVQAVSKRFRLYHEKYTSLKEKVIHIGRTPHEDLWALQDVSFDVKEGETVGILGRNGSGKSTLLKCVCGVLQPTSGQVVVRGKLAGLLELGAGFQQDLSGRENIYLNGSMLGLSKREVDRMFDDIVEFAELGQFIDNQVKFYSSGMYVRLGFAVAVNVDPDVLVIDEVLAVGDERFQRKCMDRIKQFQKEGRTILFVSHSPDQVRAICDRAVVLSDGEMIGMGSPGEAVRLFRERLLEAGDVLALRAEAPPEPVPPAVPDPAAPAPTADGGAGGGPGVPTAGPGPDGPADLTPDPAADAAAAVPAGAAGGAGVGGAGAGAVPAAGAPIAAAPPAGSSAATPDVARPVRLTEVTTHYPESHARPYLLVGETLTVRVGFQASVPTEGVVFQIEVRAPDGTALFQTDTEILGLRYDAPAGPGAIDFQFEDLPLFDGAYDIFVGVLTRRGMSDWREPACRFEVMNPGKSTGVVALPCRAVVAPREAVASQEPVAR